MSYEGLYSKSQTVTVQSDDLDVPNSVSSVGSNYVRIKNASTGTDYLISLADFKSSLNISSIITTLMGLNDVSGSMGTEGQILRVNNAGKAEFADAVLAASDVVIVKNYVGGEDVEVKDLVFNSADNKLYLAVTNGTIGAVADPLVEIQQLVQKGQANGYPSLDSNGLVPLAQLANSLKNVEFGGNVNIANAPTDEKQLFVEYTASGTNLVSWGLYMSVDTSARGNPENLQWIKIVEDEDVSAVTAGDGISKVGSVVSVDLAIASGLEFAAGGKLRVVLSQTLEFSSNAIKIKYASTAGLEEDGTGLKVKIQAPIKRTTSGIGLDYNTAEFTLNSTTLEFKARNDAAGEGIPPSKFKTENDELEGGIASDYAIEQPLVYTRGSKYRWSTNIQAIFPIDVVGLQAFGTNGVIMTAQANYIRVIKSAILFLHFDNNTDLNDYKANLNKDVYIGHSNVYADYSTAGHACAKLTAAQIKNSLNIIPLGTQIAIPFEIVPGMNIVNNLNIVFDSSWGASSPAYFKLYYEYKVISSNVLGSGPVVELSVGNA